MFLSVPPLPPTPLTSSPPQVLAVGFLLVILSCALWKAYYPLLVVATYVLAPLPNWICARCANPDDFGAEGGGNALLDFGKFVTGALVVMGVGMYGFSSAGIRGRGEGGRGKDGVGGLWETDGGGEIWRDASVLEADADCYQQLSR